MTIITVVALKMLKEKATENLQAVFDGEACLLEEFDHPNIAEWYRREANVFPHRALIQWRCLKRCSFQQS